MFSVFLYSLDAPRTNHWTEIPRACKMREGSHIKMERLLQWLASSAREFMDGPVVPAGRPPMEYRTGQTNTVRATQHALWQTCDLKPRRLLGEAEAACNFFAEWTDSSPTWLTKIPDSILTRLAYNFAVLGWSAFPVFRCLLISPRIKKSGYFILASSPTARLPCLLQPAPSTTMFVPLT